MSPGMGSGFDLTYLLLAVALIALGLGLALGSWLL